MEKVYGAKERQDCLYQIGYGCWELIYGFYKDNPDDETGYNYRQKYPAKPTPQEVEEDIRKTINARTDEAILSGFAWRDMPVWLSQENQFNYKTAYDLAVQLDGANLPVTFKFGSDEAPVYHSFNSLADLREFYLGVTAHVTECIKAGWEEKNCVHDNIEIFF